MLPRPISMTVTTTNKSVQARTMLLRAGEYPCSFICNVPSGGDDCIPAMSFLGFQLLDTAERRRHLRGAANVALRWNAENSLGYELEVSRAGDGR